VQNKLSNATKNGIVTTISGFYSTEEIVEAKVKLFELVEKLRSSGCVIDGKHRLVQRKPSDNKRKLDSEDIINLFSELDAAGVRLPAFTAANLKRIPPFEPVQTVQTGSNATDICSLTAAVGMLQTQFGDMQKKLYAVYEHVSAVNSTGTIDHQKTWGPSDHQQSSAEHFRIGETITGPVSKVTTAYTSAAIPTRDTGDAASERSVSDHQHSRQWSSLIDTESKTHNDWTLISPRRTGTSRSTTSTVPSRPKTSVKLTGSRNMTTSTSEQSVKAVPRKAVLSAYVGRLQKDTTDEALTRFLSDVGLVGVVCKKLKAKEGRVFNTSAFYVTCSAECKDLFYNEASWPEGVELRDWVYFN
jgi:hypothetical protein